MHRCVHMAACLALLLGFHSAVAAECRFGELANLYVADQKDREAQDPVTHKRKIDWDLVHANDAKRLARVHVLLKHGCLQSSEDYYRAAVISQHGPGIEDVRLAFALATIAVALNPGDHNARFMTAAAWDRIMMDAHLPQWFATQYQKTASGEWVLYKTDPKIVSDEDRRKLGLPTLLEAEKYAAELNSRER